MLIGDGGVRIPGPICERRPYGLDSAAELEERGDYAWLKGLEFDEEICASGAPAVSRQCPPLLDDMSTPKDPQGKSSHRGFNVEYSDPFVLYEGYDCSVGGAPPSEAWDRAAALLEKTWLRGLERALWTGRDQDDNVIRMSLGGGEPEDLTPGTDPSVLAGVALLEEYASGFTACVPTIHVPTVLGPYMGAKVLLKERDGGMYTPTGSRVVLGAGYTREGPDGSTTPAGSAWMYVSGGVKVVYGPTFWTPERGDLGGAVDRLVNDIEVFAEKGFSLMLGCGLAAVRVSIGGDGGVGSDAIDGGSP
jgi:hypothetical protein